MAFPLADGTIPEVGMRVWSIPDTHDEFAMDYLKSYATIEAVDSTHIGCFCSFPETEQEWWFMNEYLVPYDTSDKVMSVRFCEDEFLSLIGGDSGG